MSRRSVIGRVAVVAGLAGSLVAMRAGSVGSPPLYDGVVSADPYRWLTPAAGQLGGATGADSTLQVTAGASPAITVGTPEQPPQAQLIAGPGALELGLDTTGIVVSLTPVPVLTQPVGGEIAGNVYRISITTQTGASVGARADALVTLALRVPATFTTATIERLENGSWVALPTASSGFPGMFETTGLTAFGDFALVGQPANPSSPVTVLLDAALLLVVAGGLVLALGGSVAILISDRRHRR
jgi:hypothetical protein